MQVVYSRVRRADLLEQLREHLQRNIVRFGKIWHYQCHGIPQVGRLSQEWVLANSWTSSTHNPLCHQLGLRGWKLLPRWSY